jgi:hypothetical protein
MAVIITLVSVVFQRVTGPTYSLKGVTEAFGQNLKFKLPRSHDTGSSAEVRVVVPDRSIAGELRHRRYKSNDSWSFRELSRSGDTLVANVPEQPAAGKVMYQIALIDSTGLRLPLTEEPVVMRFKDPVPSSALWPHIVLMFAAMLLATRTGIEALAREERMYRMALWTSALLFAGGIVLGPIVQKYAFGAAWTGWPIGNDLTDNKTAVAMIVWVIALLRGRKSSGCRGWVIAASIATLLVYLVPHSVLGSEIDYTKTE